MVCTIGGIVRLTILAGITAGLGAACGSARAGFIEVQFPSGPQNVTSIPPAATLDESFSGAGLGDAYGVADSASWTFKGTVAVAPPPSSTFGVVARIADTVHFSGTGTVTAHWTADGIVTLPVPDPSTIPVLAHLLMDMNVGGSSTGLYNIDVGYASSAFLSPPNILVPGGVPFAVHLDTHATFSVVDGESRVLDTELQLLGLCGALLDFSDGARLTFDLSAGVTVRGDGGYFQSATVPEPSSCVMLASSAVIAAIGHVIRRRAG
jgi:hypothetical protein